MGMVLGILMGMGGVGSMMARQRQGSGVALWATVVGGMSMTATQHNVTVAPVFGGMTTKHDMTVAEDCGSEAGYATVAEDCGWQVRVPGNTIWARDTGVARDDCGRTTVDRGRDANYGYRVSDKLAQQTSPTPQITDITIHETRRTDRQCNGAVTTKGTMVLQESTTQAQTGNDEILAGDKT